MSGDYSYLTTEWYRGRNGLLVRVRCERVGCRWLWFYSDANWTHREVGPFKGARGKFFALLDYAHRCGLSGAEAALEPA